MSANRTAKRLPEKIAKLSEDILQLETKLKAARQSKTIAWDWAIRKMREEIW